MFRNYFVVLLRNVIRNPFYFFINLLGLTAGITCCLLILSYVKYELSYDQFHSKNERIYRINYDVTTAEGTQVVSPSVPLFVGPYLKANYPEVEDAVRLLHSWSPRTVQYEDKLFDVDGFCWGDSSLANVFDFRVVNGNITEALNSPGKVVITESAAKKYFGNETPLDKVFRVDNKRDFEVAAVIKDIPPNSTFRFDILASIYSLPDIDDNTISWYNPNYETYLLVKGNTKLDEFQKKLDDWTQLSTTKSDLQFKLFLPLEPLSEIHFNTNVYNYKSYLAITDYNTLGTFAIVAILIFLVACVNYINLSTAKSTLRAKEVGLRKAVGASFKQLVIQFLSETSLLIVPALLLSMILSSLLTVPLSEMLGKTIPMEGFSFQLCIVLFFSWILISILAGFYPAMVMSRFRTVNVLKGKYVQSGFGVSLRKGLVVFQFSISTFLVISTIIILAQLEFMQNKTLGFNEEHVMVIRGNSEVSPKLDVLANHIRSFESVGGAAKTNRSPFETVIGNAFTLDMAGLNDWDLVGMISADEQYLSTMGIDLKLGRNFDPARINGDSLNTEFIVNEEFLKHFGLSPEDALGRKAWLATTHASGPGTIVGVVKDFHTSSLHEKVAPIVLCNHPEFFDALMVRISGVEIENTVSEILKVWEVISPSRLLNYAFIDQQYDALYKTDQRISTLIGLFSLIAILVGCLGLFGLASFTSFQRAREIGIRKVLGATTGSLVGLLTGVYVRLLIVAFFIGVPLCYLIIGNWLEQYPYHIVNSPVYYVGGIILVLLVAWGTVAFQSYKASVSNPVDTLKSE